MEEKNMKRVFYLPYSPKNKVFLICFPSTTKVHRKMTCKELTLNVLSDTTLYTRKEMPKVFEKLNVAYPDIKAVKITMTFTETTLIG